MVDGGGGEIFMTVTDFTPQRYIGNLAKNASLAQRIYEAMLLFTSLNLARIWGTERGVEVMESELSH